MNFFKKLIKSIPYLVQTAEQYAEDDIITHKERKNTVLKWIKVNLELNNITLSKLQWWILSYLIDKAAYKIYSKDIVIPPVLRD